jgi:50S ribosomal subunit-associated GTPase HflX
MVQIIEIFAQRARTKEARLQVGMGLSLAAAVRTRPLTLCGEGGRGGLGL